MLGVLVLHLSVYVPVLSKFEQWPSAAYLVLMPLEGMAIVIVLKLVLGVLPDPNVQL